MMSRLTGTVAAIAFIVIGLSALDRFLASVESAELSSSARRSYLAGSRLLAEGKAAAAVDPLQEAHAVERENREYALTLIAALMTAGKMADAETLMNELLEREPNDGRTNLAAARLKAKEGNFADAESYYHRAIYGAWPGEGHGRRTAVRLELIDLLKKRDRKQELLAELISLEAEATADPETQKRLARLFLAADSPARAARIYRATVQKNPKDAAAYEGLGQAELAQGEYAAAHAAFEAAFLRDPNDASILSHLVTLNTVVALDPTVRKLTSAEKYSRSMRILEMARAGLAQCVASNPSGGSGEAGRLLTASAATIASKAPAHATNEIAEGVLGIAEAVWRAQNQACGTPAGDDDALNLIMKKVTS